ncbi:MAG: hypothetical protein NG740_07065 [Omnitrophica bacterium]|nr:hypothetical protein [Candidatus Omnitrophota bacterium]
MLKLKKSANRNLGMTLTEVLVAVAVSMFLMCIVVSMWIFTYKNWAIERARTKLRVNLEVAMERIKSEARLSSSTYASLYDPDGGTNYKAISFPAPTYAGNLLTLNANGNILWGSSIIYHVYSGELRRTEFTGNNTVLLNATNRDLQLASVVTNGDGSAWTAVDGETSSTPPAIVKNVDAFTIVPSLGLFDGYSLTTKRSDSIEFGSVNLDPTYASGYHDFTFTAVGQNGLATGYDLGIDSISIAPSGYEREAEYYDPGNTPYAPSGESVTAVGCSRSKVYNLSASGNNFLETSGTSNGDSITLRMYYDLWRESNFQNSVRTNTILTGNDLYVKLVTPEEGGEATWEAMLQTGTGATDYNDAVPLPIIMSNISVRNVISAADIGKNSDVFRVNFKAHSSLTSIPVTITKAYLWERSSAEDADATAPLSGRRIQLYFTSSGVVSPSVTISGGSSVDSNWAIFPIVTTKSYFVTFHISSGNVTYWPDAVTTNQHSYLARDSTQSSILVAPWSTNLNKVGDNLPISSLVNDGDYISTPNIFVTASIEGWSETGEVVSSIYDTKLTNPNYGRIAWKYNTPAGTSVAVQAQSSSNSNMSSSSGWATVSNGGSLPVGMDNKRYVQFKAVLSTLPASNPYWTCVTVAHSAVKVLDPAYKAGGYSCTINTAEWLLPAVSTPWIDDVTIDWPGPARVCDVSGYFMKKPNYGIIKLTVDGNDLIKGYEFDLTLSEDVRGKIYGESLAVEIEPRNTGL